MPYKNPDEYKSYQRAYKKTQAWKNSLEKRKKSGKTGVYIKAYRESGRAQKAEKKYDTSHPERRILRRAEIRKQVLDGMGGKCVQCSFSDYRALQIDHVNGDGIHERKLQSKIGYLTDVLKSFLAGEGRYQILCCNCNWIKRVENREYRKKTPMPAYTQTPEHTVGVREL